MAKQPPLNLRDHLQNACALAEAHMNARYEQPLNDWIDKQQRKRARQLWRRIKIAADYYDYFYYERDDV